MLQVPPQGQLSPHRQLLRHPATRHLQRRLHLAPMPTTARLQATPARAQLQPLYCQSRVSSQSARPGSPCSPSRAPAKPLSPQSPAQARPLPPAPSQRGARRRGARSSPQHLGPQQPIPLQLDNPVPQHSPAPQQAGAQRLSPLRLCSRRQQHRRTMAPTFPPPPARGHVRRLSRPSALCAQARRLASSLQKPSLRLRCLQQPPQQLHASAAGRARPRLLTPLSSHRSTRAVRTRQPRPRLQAQKVCPRIPSCMECMNDISKQWQQSSCTHPELVTSM